MSGTADAYRTMAERQCRGLSPAYEALCLGVAGDAEILARLDALPEPQRQPNLLLGTVRFLNGPTSSWPGFREFVLDRWDDVTATMRARRTQTNEPGRCATLLPSLALLPQPLALFEVGASAGLCLYPDRYSYRYDTVDGDHLVGSGPELVCAVTGPAPLPSTTPRVVWRGGLDLHPLDVRIADDARWLECLVWPEQQDRAAGLRAAFDVARSEPATVVTGDLGRDLVTAASKAPADATLVVFHSAVLAYVDAPGRRAFRNDLERLASIRPVHWLANEAPGLVPGTARYRTDGPARFVLTHDGAPVALTGPHGQTLDWLGDA